MSRAFYRKYRSKSLGEVVGQEHITTILEAALKQNKIAHAYLLTGPRGVGKTSVARILAHEINNIPYKDESYHPDIIEIDAASNNGVDDIRYLRDQVQTAPFSAAKRIYIIDEVHMLSKQAFNALLKTLEEPPEHVVFILATTDPHKLPPTIISRTQQFVFHYISQEDIRKHLQFIADQEKIDISSEAIQIIAERGGGSFRDSISLLDQISSLNTSNQISAELLENILGLVPQKNIQKILDLYISQDVSQIIRTVDEIKNSGINMQIFIDQFILEIRNNLSDKPFLVSLLSPLIEIKNSQFIDIELLSILIKPKRSHTIATSVTTPTAGFISAPMENITMTPQKPKEVKKVSKKIEKKQKNGTKPANAITLEAKPFEWSDLLSAIKSENMPAYSIINKVDYSIESDTIKIFAGKPLYKKKLDSAKYRTIIADAMTKINAGGWRVEISSDKKPPEDETTAAVFDIMGGGEEVAVNE